MIYSLTGRLAAASPAMVVVVCGGVGYRASVSLMTLSQLPPVGDEVTIYTHMAVRDDAVELYGFCDEQELSCFKQLISVSGVGGKVALALLSDFTPDSLALAVASGDHKALTRSSGVGAKLAQRIVLELKDKLSSSISGGEEISAVASAAKEDPVSQAVSALVALGYSQTEAVSSLARCDVGMTVEELIKAGLKNLAKSRI